MIGGNTKKGASLVGAIPRTAQREALRCRHGMAQHADLSLHSPGSRFACPGQRKGGHFQTWGRPLGRCETKEKRVRRRRTKEPDRDGQPCPEPAIHPFLS